MYKRQVNILYEMYAEEVASSRQRQDERRQLDASMDARNTDLSFDKQVEDSMVRETLLTSYDLHKTLKEDLIMHYSGSSSM